MYKYFVSYATIGEDNSIGFGNCFMNLDSKIVTPETIKEMNAWISKDVSFAMPRRAVVLNFILVENESEQPSGIDKNFQIKDMPNPYEHKKIKFDDLLHNLNRIIDYFSTEESHMAYRTVWQAKLLIEDEIVKKAKC